MPTTRSTARTAQLAFEEWEDNQEGDRPNPAIHRAWINFVLKQTLGLPDEVLAEGQDIPQTLKATIAEHGETLRPDVVVRNPGGRAQTPGRPGCWSRSIRRRKTWRSRSPGGIGRHRRRPG